jgi:ABC-type phosphonate transport system ATPase subunit
MPSTDTYVAIGVFLLAGGVLSYFRARQRTQRWRAQLERSRERLDNQQNRPSNGS